jgi:tetratricopeptide (TPR) repeat protein
MEISLGDFISADDIQVKDEPKAVEPKAGTSKSFAPGTEGSKEVKDENLYNINIKPVKGRLCLNMIVKNESRIITRLLETVVPIIDTYCICDTGSTDDTPTIIRDFMKKHDKPGIVFVEPFKTFGYNRSVALKRADDWGQYALLLDADMKLIIRPEFLAVKDKLTADGYQIIQQNSDIKYYNTRIVKTNIGVKCVSPTHEYYDFPKGSTMEKLEYIYIDDIGDGGSKGDKYTRDIRLLKEGLEEEPKNARYHFYLANTYKNIGDHREAIKFYTKRVELGGWHEEVFYSLFEIGNCYSSLNENEKAVYYWLEAWNKHPARTESLYEVVKHYRVIGKHNIAQYFCDLGLRTPYPKDDLLFIKHNVYDHLFEYEQSVLYYYTKKPINYSIFLKLIGRDCYKQNVLSNYEFYTKVLKPMAKQYICFNEKVEKEIGGVTDNFVSSSPCIIPYKGNYLMNIRYVNYHIEPNGSYKFKLDDGKIRTLNRFVYLSNDFKITKDHWFDKVHNTELRYQGVEDIKIYQHKQDLLFSGTAEGKDGAIRIGHNKVLLGMNALIPQIIESPFGRGCEKNWVFFTQNDGALRMIYEWGPLITAEINESGDRLTKLRRDEDVPPFFKDVRGSTNGCRIENEIWFLCHMVNHTQPRSYWHLFVILDAKTLKYKKHSILFKFEKERIEYALGLVVEPKQVVISYSTWDRTSAIITLSRNKIHEELFI